MTAYTSSDLALLGHLRLKEKAFYKTINTRNGFDHYGYFI